MISVLGTDPILCRMLTLEAARGGFSLTTPEDARLWLLDLDHPPRPLPQSKSAYVVGFSASIIRTARADFVLPLPYPTKELQQILATLLSHSDAPYRPRHLPGALLIGERKIRLSPTEERLFLLLSENRGKTVPEQALLAALKDSIATTNVLQVHIHRLRRKLSIDGTSYIRAVRGVGYRLTT